MSQRPLHRVALTSSTFGAEVACLGAQLEDVLRTLYPEGTTLRWYYSDVEANKRSSLSEAPGVHQAGDLDQLLTAVRTVDQFQRGVFFGSDVSAPRFREDPNTEDAEFANVGDAEVEIRAFDTTSFEIYSSDASLLGRLSERYGVKVEAWSERPEASDPR